MLVDISVSVKNGDNTCNEDKRDEHWQIHVCLSVENGDNTSNEDKRDVHWQIHVFVSRLIGKTIEKCIRIATNSITFCFEYINWREVWILNEVM